MDLHDLPLPDDLVVHTCGPPPFMQAVRTSLIARGAGPSDIHYEVFGPDLWANQPPAEPVTSVPSSPSG